MVAVEVVRYGDFDMSVTDSVWINEKMPNKAFNPKTLGEFGWDRDTERVFRVLKAAGFKKLYTQPITIGGEH